MENSRNDKIIELLEYTTKRRNANLSDGELNGVVYWNGYIDGLKRAMAVINSDGVIKLGDIITARSNLECTVTGMVTVIDNSPTSLVPSVLVRIKHNDSQWCYLSDNPELKVPRVFEKMQIQQEEE